MQNQKSNELMIRAERRPLGSVPRPDPQHPHPNRAAHTRRSSTASSFRAPHELGALLGSIYIAQNFDATGVVVVIGTVIIATFVLRTVSSLFCEETSR